MNKTIRITTLVENTAERAGLLAEHGLSFHIQAGPHQLLFDTGQTDVLLRNARALGLGLDQLQAVAFSHGHYDHTGGLASLPPTAHPPRLLLHPAALAPKYAAVPGGAARAIGVPAPSRQRLHSSASLVIPTPHVTEVFEGIFLTGEIPRHTGYEDTGGPFYLDEASTQPDPLADDQALFFDTKDGVVVVFGCAHAGVVNTLHYIREITGGRPIHTILGGLHLLAADEERMVQTLAALRELNVQRIAAAHCTGLPAVARLWAAFPGRCASCAVGTTFVFWR